MTEEHCSDGCHPKEQDNGEYRCFRCWRPFVPLDAIEIACEQVEAEENEDEIKTDRRVKADY